MSLCCSVTPPFYCFNFIPRHTCTIAVTFGQYVLSISIIFLGKASDQQQFRHIVLNIFIGRNSRRFNCGPCRLFFHLGQYRHAQLLESLIDIGIILRIDPLTVAQQEISFRTQGTVVYSERDYYFPGIYGTMYFFQDPH